MKITVIYGQSHQGNTYSLTQLFLNCLQRNDSQITEFFLPDEGITYCVGCQNCFIRGERTCPHAAAVQKIVAAIDSADLIIIASACYVFGMTGQLKVLFDHLGYRFMAHRPEASMFKKQALVLSTAAGAGMSKVTKAISFNLFMWGVASIYRYGLRIGAASFEKIPARRQVATERKVKRISEKILKKRVRVKTMTRIVFAVMRLNQKKNDWNAIDKEHWEKHGWLGFTKPF